MSNAFIAAQARIADAVQAASRPRLTVAAAAALDIIADADALLASDEHFLFGLWVRDARAWANVSGTDAGASAGSDTTPLPTIAAADYYEYNARNLVTLWGPGRTHAAPVDGPGNIHDYASKQWAGLTRDFYLPRW